MLVHNGTPSLLDVVSTMHLTKNQRPQNMGRKCAQYDDQNLHQPRGLSKQCNLQGACVRWTSRQF